MKRKTVPSQHQQYKIIQIPENGKAVSMSYSNTMHTHTYRMGERTSHEEQLLI